MTDTSGKTVYQETVVTGNTPNWTVILDQSVQNTFNDEMKWGQGYGIVTVNNFVKPDNVIAKRVENAKSSYNTDDAPYYIRPSGSIYCGVNGYFDCYKNDISKEEHYKCKFVLDVPDEDDKK